jgi:hypothetical protein
VRLFLAGAAMIVPDLIARRRLHSSGSPVFRKASNPDGEVVIYWTVNLGLSRRASAMITVTPYLTP